jgi:L-asparagine transporter-like permease
VLLGIAADMGFEAVAGAAIMQKWLPGVPLWSMSLGLLMLMTATNLYSVRSYGEFEYWFALVKAAAICIFIGLGCFFVLGLWPGHSMDFSNLTARDGFLPIGPWAMFSGIVVVVFSMVGAEVATIAAAESDDPEHAVVKATNSVVMRICVFFVGSIALLVIILPWNGKWTDASPYVAAFQAMGLTWASNVMNAVVLTAVCADGCVVLPQLRAIHCVAYAFRAGRSGRGAGHPAQNQQTRRAVARDHGFDPGRLSLRRRRLYLARYRVLVPVELVGRSSFWFTF